jgi:serine/threonine-protein kinase
VLEAASILPEMLGSALVGTHIGPWRIEALLDSGGMGSVFAACRSDQDFELRAALKLVRVGFESPELLTRFSRERQLLAAIEHPHVAKLLDGGTTEEGLPWLAMEFVEGLPIDVWADRECLSIPERLQLFDQVLDAIAHVHANLVIHRDIKPSNILVDLHGQAKVLDFGISGLLDDSVSEITSTAERRLSPNSAAPEQWQGRALSTATDVYSLGVLLYGLLAGVPPYVIDNGMTPVDIERLVCEQNPQRPSVAVVRCANLDEIVVRRRTSRSRLQRELKSDLDTIVMKALAKDPGRRYGTVGELKADLERWRRNQPISARPDSIAYVSGKFMRRHWRGLSATALVAIALTSALGVSLLQIEKTRQQRDRVQAINEFMQEVLAEADPYEAGQDKRVIDVLDDAERLLPERFSGKPILEASVRQAIGGVQVSMMAMGRAEKNLETALELVNELVPQDDLLRLRTEAHLAWMATSRDQSSEAEKRYLSIIARLSDKHPVEFRATVHNDLGVVYSYWGRYEEAIVYFRRAIEIEPNSPHEISTLNNIAYCYDGMGDLEKAAEQYEQNLQTLRALYPDQPQPDLAILLNNYGNVLIQQRKVELGLSMYRESLAMRRALYGEKSASATHQTMNIGNLLMEEGRVEEAYPYLQQADALARELMEPDVFTRLVAIANFARVRLLLQKENDDLEEAVQDLSDVVVRMEASGEGRNAAFIEDFREWLREARKAE